MRPGFLAGALALLALAGAATGETSPAKLRVGTSGDYAPFSRAITGEKGPFEGFDVALAQRYAAERGLEIEWVRFRWPTLQRDLEANRFDVAMSGITVRPERSVVGSFSVPLVETGAVALVRDRDRFGSIDRLDRERVRIAVNRGGYLESVASSRFPRATLISIADNAGVVLALKESAVDAVLTDTVEASGWQREVPDAIRLGPFTRDRKAVLVAPGAAERIADLDRWLLEREADGTLAALRTEYFGPGPWVRTAEPLPALVAALDERLSLMPWVGAAKQRNGLPLEDTARESVVLDQAVVALLEAAKQRDVVAPSALLVSRFFHAQFEAAKQVQWDALRDPAYEPPETLPDLDGALRPALTRIGTRIAQLLLALPHGLDREQLASALADGLWTPWVTPSSRRALVDALDELVTPMPAPAPASTRAPAPAPSPQ